MSDEPGGGGEGEQRIRICEVSIRALKEVSFAVEPAFSASFVGPSGSGKKTLLNLVGCLDKPALALTGTANGQFVFDFSQET